MFLYRWFGSGVLKNTKGVGYTPYPHFYITNREAKEMNHTGEREQASSKHFFSSIVRREHRNSSPGPVAAAASTDSDAYAYYSLSALAQRSQFVAPGTYFSLAKNSWNAVS